MGKRKKQKNVLRMALLACVVLGGAVWTVCEKADGMVAEDKLPTEVTGVRNVETSAEKNARYEQEEQQRAAEAQKAPEELDENLTEGASEGLSRIAADNLELAAEIVSGVEMKIYKSQFIVSYNTKTMCPNYVCWALTADRVNGEEKRWDKFIGDPVMPESMRVETGDYARSGYDRGHMCPAADNKNSKRAMEESFMMTNICPQTHKLNAGDWSELENQCRSWAKNYGTVYICCGPIFDKKRPKTIGNRKDVKIKVPDRFFKVVMMLGDSPKAIGFVMPNDDVNCDLRDYVMSVDEVESITGFDFFYQIPAEIQDKIEAECKPAAWGI